MERVLNGTTLEPIWLSMANTTWTDEGFNTAAMTRNVSAGFSGNGSTTPAAYSLDYGNLTTIDAIATTRGEINTTSNGSDMFIDHQTEREVYYEYIIYTGYYYIWTKENLWKGLAPIIVIFGTLGNLLSALVMLQRGLRRYTTSFYLTVLAAVDTAILYTGLLRHWVNEVSHTDVRHLSNGGCKLHIFLTYFLIQLEAWILVSVTVERVCAVFVPYRAKMFFTRTTAAIQLAILTLSLVAFNSHFFWTFHLAAGVDNMPDLCAASYASYAQFVGSVWHWLDLGLASIVPFGVMLTCNTAIVVRLLHANHLRKINLNATSDVKLTSMTAILLTVTFTFFLTTAPICLYLSTQGKWRAQSQIGEDYLRLDLVYAALTLLAYTNNAINFLLYCISGPRFRRHLKMLFCRHRVHPAGPPPNENAGTSTV